MAQRLSNSLTYICGTVKDSFVPAFIFGTALVLFYGQMPFTSELSQLLYYIFSAVSAIVLILLYLINRSKPFFSLLLGITAFLVLNHLKHTYGQECIHQTQYIWLCFLLPLNLLVFYFLPAFRLRSKKGIIITFFLLLQMILLEHANGLILNIPFVKIYWQSMPLWSVALWFSVLVLLAINISFKNTLPNTGLFYADVALFLGFIYADNASAVSVFSLTFATILLGVTLLDLYNGYKHDILQYVDSYNLYLSRAANKFPFKYTVGLFCLDNREKIMTQAGAKSLRILEQMLINKIIEEAPEDTEIYRYKNDEFL